MIQKNGVTSLRLDKILLQLLFPCYVDSYYATKEYDDSVVKKHDKTDKSYYSEEDFPDDLLFYEEDEEDDVYDLYSYDRGGDFVSALSVIPEATNTTCSTTTFCSSDITSRSSHACVITTKILTNASSLTLDDVDKNNSKISTISVDARDDSATTVRSIKSWNASPFFKKSDSGSLKPIRVYQGTHNFDIKTESSCSTIERKSNNGNASSVSGISYGESKTVSTMDVMEEGQSSSSAQKWEGSSSKSGSRIVSDDNLVQNSFYCEDFSSGSGRARNNNTSSGPVSSSICEKNSFESLVRHSDTGFTTKSNRSKIQGSTCSIDGSKYSKEKINTDIDSRDDNLSVSSLRKYVDDSKISNNKPVKKNYCKDLSSRSLASQDNPVQNCFSYRDLSSESKKAEGDITNDESSTSCNIFERNSSDRSIWRSNSGITNKSSGCRMKNVSKIEECAFFSMANNRDEDKVNPEADVSDDCPSISSLQKSVKRKQNDSSVPSDNYPMRQNVSNEHSSSKSVYTRNSATDSGLSLLSSDDCERNNSKGFIRRSDSSVATKSTSRNLKKKISNGEDRSSSESVYTRNSATNSGLSLLSSDDCERNNSKGFIRRSDSSVATKSTSRNLKKKISNAEDRSSSIMDKILCDKNPNEMNIVDDILSSFSSQNDEGRNRSSSSIEFGDSSMERCHHCPAFSDEINSAVKNTTASSDASKSDIKDMKNTPTSTATQHNEKDNRGRNSTDERRDNSVSSARLQRLEQNEIQSFNRLKMGNVSGKRTKDEDEYNKSFSSRQKYFKEKFRFLNSDKLFWLPCLRTIQLRYRK
jgi:hypothetical protein